MKKSLTLGFVPAIFAALFTISGCTDRSFAEGSFDLSSVGNMEGSMGNVGASLAVSAPGLAAGASAASFNASSAASSVASSVASSAANAANKQAMCTLRKMLRQPGYAAWHSNEGQTYMTQGCATGPGNLLTLP